jgi:hypothetical protein
MTIIVYRRYSADFSLLTRSAISSEVRKLDFQRYTTAPVFGGMKST